MRNRKAALIAASLALVVVAARHPSANIQVLTHSASDPSPNRFQAAVDIGLVAVSILVTWTGSHLQNAR